MLPAWLFRENSCIICILFYLVGSDVRQAHDQPRASLCHELAGQWINLSTNSFKAQAALPARGALPPLARGKARAVPGLFKASEILYTWHKRVHTCLYGVYDMYVLCYSMYISYTPFRHVHTFLKMCMNTYIQFWIFINLTRSYIKISINFHLFLLF